MEMEAASSSPSASLRHRLRATVCCCFGAGAALGERMQWRRRAGVGEFRYDPLSYALNFDDQEEGDDDDVDGVGHADGLLYRSFSSRLPPSPPPPPARPRATATTTVAVTVA